MKQKRDTADRRDYVPAMLESSSPIESAATVLLVEDEAFVREVTREILHAAGYRVLESRNAADAKRAVEPHAAEVHILLTDVVLPDQNGIDLATELMSVCPRLKVVFISGYCENAVTKSGLSRRGVFYLRKPYSTSALMEMIQQMLEESRAKYQTNSG